MIPHTKLLQRWSIPELLKQPSDFGWLISGLLADPTYGQVAGEMKTLKTHVTMFIAVGLASGVPIFDQFVPRQDRPVVTYIGEGGRIPWTRLLKRVCKAMDVNPADLDVHPVFDVAPIASPVFQESLRRDLREIEPGLVQLDPYYAYHGTEMRASDLHQEGSLLNQLLAPCADVGSTLQVVNHMNQTGAGMSLKRITMSGSGEWSDSWLLLGHRQNPDVEKGLFRLTMDVGSRQWGGTSWNLDLDVGRFDVATGQYDGQIAWDLRRGGMSGPATGVVTSRNSEVKAAILATVSEHPWELTKTEIKRATQGSRQLLDKAFAELEKGRFIAQEHRGRDESGTTKSRDLWGPLVTTADVSRPGSSELAA